MPSQETVDRIQGEIQKEQKAPPVDLTSKEISIIATKNIRVKLDGVLQELKGHESTRKSRERSLAVTKIQEAIMWLGMDLKEIGGTPNPYPNSYNTENVIVDKTADGLKL